MKVINLMAARWFRAARKELPAPRLPGQSVPERCRETFAEEVNWFAERLARARKRQR